MSNGNGAVRLRVLVVDDTPDIRLLLSAALGALGGFEVVGEAENGLEAVRMAGELQPDAVLLDLAMPIMDGLQAAPEIRKCSPSSRIIILSGFSKDRMEAEALEVGADAFIEKGASPRHIAESIRGLCERGTPPFEPPPAQLNDTVADGRRTAPPTRDPLEEWRRSINRAVDRAPELGSAFEAFGDVVAERVSFDRAGLCISDENGYNLAAVSGPADGRLPLGTTVPIRGKIAIALDDGRSVTAVDTATGDETVDKYFHDRGMRSYAAVPVLAAGRAHAVVGFSTFDQREFNDDELVLLEAAVREAAAAFYMLYCMKRKQEIDEKSLDSEQARIEWNRIVRHDLRSPLTVISGFARTMQEAWPELADDKKLEFVEAILRGATSMGRLLSDMEQVDNLDSGVRIDPAKPLDLADVVEQTVADMVGGGGRTVITHIPCRLPKALADEASQRRVLSNLLENAFKFSPATEPVEVTVTHDDDVLHVSVRDYGIGIRQEDQSKLFQKFSRITTSDGTRPVRGSGLGLYICKSLVEAQGGSISVSSELGAGTTFAYSVPVAPTA